MSHSQSDAALANVRRQHDVSCSIGDMVCHCVFGLKDGSSLGHEHNLIPKSDETEGCVWLVTCDTPIYWDSRYFVTSIRYVFVPDSVREIKAGTFYKCWTLSVVVFGPHSSLERICCDAFCRSGLTKIWIPDSVREIGDRCFLSSDIVDVMFGLSPSLELIGYDAFSYTKINEFFLPGSVRRLCGRCFALNNIRRFTFGVPSCLEHIGKEAFCQNECLPEIIIPDSVRSLGSKFFWDCGSLSLCAVGLASSLEVISRNAFTPLEALDYRMTGTTLPRYFLVPDSVRILDSCLCDVVSFSLSSSLERIGSEVFMETLIRDITIPHRVRDIGDRCFWNCKNLLRVSFRSPCVLDRNGDCRFSTSGLCEICLPDSLTYIGGGAFSNCSLTNDKICGTSSNFFVYDSLLIDKSTLRVCSLVFDVHDVCIPDFVCELADRCFQGCANLCSIKFDRRSSCSRFGWECFSGSSVGEIHLPGSLTCISGTAFSNCNLSNDSICGASSNFCVCDCLLIDKSKWQLCSLVSAARYISVPDFVHELCDGCFKNRSGLRHVAFTSPSKVERIGVESFSGASVVEISIPDSVRELCDRCFCKCETLKYVTFGTSSSLELIGAESFFGTMISDICIPDRVVRLSERCFYRCESLSRVVFRASSSLETIGVECFSMTSVRNLFIPDCVRDLCDRCFYECPSLSRIRFGRFSSLERIGVGAFLGTKVRSIHIPDHVCCLGDRCFYKCRELTAVTFGKCSFLERIGNEALSRTGIEWFVIPQSLFEIGDRCFYNCPDLISVQLPHSGVVFLSDNNFAYCPKLKDINFNVQISSLPIGISPNITFNLLINSSSSSSKQPNYCGILKNIHLEENFCSLQSARTCGQRFHSTSLRYAIFILFLIK